VASERVSSGSLQSLAGEIVGCRRCPRLVEHRELVARTKRRAYRDDEYWGRPLPGFGDPNAWLVVVGLAPGAHGANRTGRVFTGDRSGDFLYPALHRAGLATRAASTSQGDGLELRGVFIALPVRCVPPDNMPTKDELASCESFFSREVALLPNARVFLALGAIAWASTLRLLGATRMLRFGHGARADVGDAHVVASYHVSQQNTQTGRLTPAKFDAILQRVMRLEGATSKNLLRNGPREPLRDPRDSNP
jgi:uracil-DNA glycosylase family 4